MPKVLLALCFLTLLRMTASSQILLDFSSADQLNYFHFDTTKFKIENGVLRLNGDPEIGRAYISHESNIVDSANWSFDFYLDFNPSTNNYFIVYLTQSDSLVGNSKGYFLKVGGSKDEISLYRFDSTYTEKIIDGTDDRVNFATVNGSIQVVRNVDLSWELFSRINEEPEFQLEGVAIDDLHLESRFFAIECTFTSTRKDKFYFDNIAFSGNPYRDRQKPYIESIQAFTSRHLRVRYSESLAAVGEELVLLPFSIQPDSFLLIDDYADLHFSEPLKNHTNYTLQQRNLVDLAGNSTEIAEFEFYLYYREKANPYDLVISELHPDPTPTVGLPDSEFIELFNRSSKTFNLQGWSLADPKSKVVLDSILLHPGEHLLLIPTASVINFKTFGPSLGLSKWINLNNSGDSLWLYSADSTLIDHLSFDQNSYQNKDKANGGWSLERIDMQIPCFTHANWQASASTLGGTPGAQNSVSNKLKFELIGSKMLNSTSAKMEFNIPINCDYVQIATEQSYLQIEPYCNETTLDLVSTQPFRTGFITLEIQNLKDCAGNSHQLQAQLFVDVDPPNLESVSNIYSDQIDLRFSEDLATFNFSLDHQAVDVITYPSRPDSISLMLQQEVAGDVLIHYEVTDSLANYHSDLYRYQMKNIQSANFGDIVISEVMVNPDLRNQLPNAEYVEIYNQTGNTIPLRGYMYADATSQVILDDGFIGPYGFAILCSSAAKVEFTDYGIGNVIAVDPWPVLNNDEEVIRIKNPGNEIIDEFIFNHSNYANLDFRNPSLEKVDLLRLCDSQTNWDFSEAETGGSPGLPNSVSASNPDLQLPELETVFLPSDESIMVFFNEVLHPNSNPKFQLDPPIAIKSFHRRSGSSYELVLNERLSKSSPYKIVVAKVADCNGNEAMLSSSPVIIPDVPKKSELVINEIMFDPTPESEEFVELYNASNKYFSLDSISIQIGKKMELVSGPIIGPGEFKVLTKDKRSLLNYHPSAPSTSIVETGVPALNNDSSTILLLNRNLTIDSVRYSNSWHYSLLDNTKGVSLEKVNYSLEGHERSSWFSASKKSGYSTPGTPNSHNVIDKTTARDFWLEDVVFSPNNDGYKDIAILRYSNNDPGRVANLRVFNVRGDLVNYLSNNFLLASDGFFTWDGLDDQGNALPTGYYIIHIEVFDGSGYLDRQKFKIALFQNSF